MSDIVILTADNVFPQVRWFIREYVFLSGKNRDAFVIIRWGVFDHSCVSWRMLLLEYFVAQGFQFKDAIFDLLFLIFISGVCIFNDVIFVLILTFVAAAVVVGGGGGDVVGGGGCGGGGAGW